MQTYTLLSCPRIIIYINIPNRLLVQINRLTIQANVRYQPIFLRIKRRVFMLFC